MADYGRSGDHIRDRDGRGHGGGGGWGDGDRDHHRPGDSARGGGMFGSSSGGDDDWSSGRREELGWGRAERDASSPARGRDEQGRGGSGRSHGARDEQGWGGSDRSRGVRDEPIRGDHSRGDHSRGEQSRGEQSRGGGRSSHNAQSRERQFGYDDNHEGLPIDETSRLIASNKVEGTAVYSRDGSRMGSIYNFMVDKRSGKVEYAVMTYGGFLGMGTRYYPMPWEILEYDTRLGGYRVDMMERDLERAPSFDRNSEPDFDHRYNDRVRGWYGLGR